MSMSLPPFDDVQLLKFKEQTGHCLVPNRYKADIELGHWGESGFLLLFRFILLYLSFGLLAAFTQN